MAVIGATVDDNVYIGGLPTGSTLSNGKKENNAFTYGLDEACVDNAAIDES